MQYYIVNKILSKYYNHVGSHLIRTATQDDISWLSDQMENFAFEYGTKIRPCPSSKRAMEQLWSHYLGLDDFCCWIASRDGENVGVLAARLVPHMFNPELIVLLEMVWWVAHEHRRSRAGYLLLREFTHHGKACADWLVLCIRTKTEINKESLEKMGYTHYESNFLLEV